MDSLTPVIGPDRTDTSANSNARAWKDFVHLINGRWCQGAGDFIACGQYLLDAKDELARDTFNVMIKSKLTFDSSVARKLMLIAGSEPLCAPGHKLKLPPAWTILYELSKLEKKVLEAALADGRVRPGMSRKDAIALRAPKKTTTKATTAKPSPSTASAELNIAWWNSIPAEQRQAFLDQLGREGLCAVMSGSLLADLRDHVIGLAVAGASRSTSFATYATDKLHVALRCAEQPEPNDESVKTMAAALGCIAKKAAAKSIARSDVVIAEGRPKGRR
jgi:hypothetical protein